MNIAQAVLYLYPNADPLNDFRVQDNGDEREWLTPDGKRPTKTVQQPIPNAPELKAGETPKESVHFEYVEAFMPDNEMTEGVHYKVVNRGQQIAYWDEAKLGPQPTEAELQTAWDEFQGLPPAPPVETPEQKIERLEVETAGWKQTAQQAQATANANSTDLQGLMDYLAERGVL